MSNKGISLVSVIVIIIVMIIIATISIVAGNKLIFETKELKDNQTIESIKEAMNRLNSEINSSGTITPKGENYIGRASPAVGTGEERAYGWYLLDEEELTKLGIKEQKGRYLVNYEYNEVLDMNEAGYYERYNVINFMHDQITEMNEAKKNGTSFTCFGFALQNKSDENDGKVMYKNFNSARQTEMYGTGWYYINPETNILPEKYQGKITNEYLINYELAKYVKVTKSFERIGD